MVLKVKHFLLGKGNGSSPIFTKYNPGHFLYKNIRLEGGEKKADCSEPQDPWDDCHWVPQVFFLLHVLQKKKSKAPCEDQKKERLVNWKLASTSSAKAWTSAVMYWGHRRIPAGLVSEGQAGSWDFQILSAEAAGGEMRHPGPSQLGCYQQSCRVMEVTATQQ